jgi:hypothetical protein
MPLGLGRFDAEPCLKPKHQHRQPAFRKALGTDDHRRASLNGLGAKEGQFFSEERFLARRRRQTAAKKREKEWPTKGAKSAVRPAGLEPATLSSED